MDPVANAEKYFFGIVTKDRVVGVPEGTAINLPLHKKRPRSWHPEVATVSNTAPRSPPPSFPAPVTPTPSPSPAAFIDNEMLPRVSLTSSPAAVPSPAAFIDYEMSPRVSLTSSPIVAFDDSERMEESQSRSSSVTSKAAESRQHDHNVTLKKRKLTTDKPISQSANVLPLREWEIADLINNDYGSEDDNDDMDDGEDGPTFPMSSVLPRSQRAWLYDLIEEEQVSETQSVSQLASPPEAQESLPSLSQLAYPPEVLAQETSPSSLQFATSPEIEISAPTHTLPALTEKPYSMWEFDWKPFSEHTVPPPCERMEIFDQPTGPVRSFQTPYEVFTAIWSPQILQHIVDQTNAYAQLIVARQMEEGTLEQTSRLAQWKDLTIDELLVYFALLMAMGLLFKSNIREYWASQGDVTDTPNFGKYMSVNRFENITRALHFNDDCDPQLRTLPKPQAKLFKIEPILSHLNHKFQELYHLSRDIALDESLTEWKGWLDINQFIKNKSASIGIKSYEVCDSRTGYLWRFKIYAGREETEEQEMSPVSGITSRIVLELVRDLEHRGHVLFMDNYYNSPALARCLKTLGFDVVGTLRPNRQFVPAEFKMTKTQMAPGQVYGATSGDVDIVVWRDQNKVCMISTYHGLSQF
ncbi:unnamed protein product [Colias eurytheme]|nr:unnamed protein product [Colias eurytheme]